MSQKCYLHHTINVMTLIHDITGIMLLKCSLRHTSSLRHTIHVMTLIDDVTGITSL
jgi:hypothetical protein